MNISKEILDEVALSEKEYKLIVQQLGREPNELALKGVVVVSNQQSELG